MNRPHKAIRLAVCSICLASSVAQAEKMQVGFLWHMHQPTYFPGETVTQTDAAGHYSYSVTDIHNQRFGPYTTWPKDAIQIASGLPNAGASVSFSGSLMQNLNNLRDNNVNGGMWNFWDSSYRQAMAMKTAENNSRLDMIGFNWAHSLMPLLDTRDMRMQIQLHKQEVANTFGTSVPYSKGFFPAETAFSERMIPALQAEGIDWTIVDNIHFDRATQNYPHTDSSNLYAPNRADQINPDPAASGGAWVQLNNLWAPSKVSAPFSYRPHNVQYVDPNSGTTQKIVAVPGARYEGNEDARGGYGAFLYQTVMDQYRQYNTDPAHPMLVVLHHDGDNYGGGSDSYYHSNFQNMVNWANGNPNYNVTTISDYLKKFPVAGNDVIHVENGSWAGADNGDPQFLKWLGKPSASGWSPDRNSWAVLTAAKNRVFMADDIAPHGAANNILYNTGSSTDKAWHYLIQSEASDYWYWDGTQVWDSMVTVGCNQAVAHANQVINGYTGPDQTAPSVFLPQRDTWNPGATEFGQVKSPDFKIWTYAYDVSGLGSVILKYRVDADGINALNSTQNETFAGGSEVGAWVSVPMTGTDILPPGNITPAQYRALQYAANINGQRNVLLDYYVEAVDGAGNITKSDIQHVYVGNQGGTLPQPDFTMDGAVDAGVNEIAGNNGMKLWQSYRNGKLYAATWATGSGNDHFIFVAKEPGALQPAPWGKAGQVAQWDAYLAGENDNTYSGWFDAVGATANAKGANGAALEGWIDLTGQYGYVPDEIYLSVGIWPTADGSTLGHPWQVPASLDNDGNIQANEFIKVSLPVGWANAAGSNWNDVNNWREGIVPNALLARARFYGGISGATSISVDIPVSVNQLNFNSAAAYTLVGTNTITLDAPSGATAQVNVLAGNHQIAAPLALNKNTSFNVAGACSITLSNLQASSVNLTKTGAGTLEINALQAGGLNISGGKVMLTAALNPTGASVVNSLLISGDGQLDLSNNLLIVRHSGARDAIRTLIQSGSNGVDANGLANWNGPGIVSSTARALNVMQSINLYTVAVIRNGDLDDFMGAGNSYSIFGGLNVSAEDILVRFTYNGDTDLNGSITFSDYVNIDSTYGGTRSINGWVSGDFNNDGSITFEDYVAIDTAYAFQTGSLSQTLLNQRLTQFGPAYVQRLESIVSSFSIVPEPVGLSIVATATMFLSLCRPSRKSSTQ